MNSVQQQKEQANSLRKKGSFKMALPIYQGLWGNVTRDKFDGAGYLHCLRKLKMYDEALPVANECEKNYSDFKWGRIEIIWTYIGILKSKSENESIGSILPLVNRIMNLTPDDLQTNTTILFLLKKAKQFRKWDIAVQWIDKIKPETLEKEPITIEKGNTGWSNYLIWHHHKIRCLIHQKKYQEAIEMVENIIGEANQEKKFFRVLESQAYDQIGQSEKAIQILTDLSNGRKVDWWIVHQHAKILKNMGEREKALEKMYIAASLSFKLESIVTLIFEIATLCEELNRIQESYYHLLLYKLIREKREWLVTKETEELIRNIGISLNVEQNLKFKEVREKCQTYWGSVNSNNKPEIRNSKKNLRGSLSGYLIKVKEDRPFCFIKTQKESFFCYKSDIQGEVKEGLEVQFEVVPSFDKKKQRESWKAINIVLM